MKKFKRFCCWCGKVEYTEKCESESIKEAARKVAESLSPTPEQSREVREDVINHIDKTIEEDEK